MLCWNASSTFWSTHVNHAPKIVPTFDRLAVRSLRSVTVVVFAPFRYQMQLGSVSPRIQSWKKLFISLPFIDEGLQQIRSAVFRAAVKVTFNAAAIKCYLLTTLVIVYGIKDILNLFTFFVFACQFKCSSTSIIQAGFKARRMVFPAGSRHISWNWGKRSNRITHSALRTEYRVPESEAIRSRTIKSTELITVSSCLGYAQRNPMRILELPWTTSRMTALSI